MGPYPETLRGNRFIFVVTDLFTRWIEAYPLPRTNATTLVSLLEDDVFVRFGYPQTIITDNGKQFNCYGPALVSVGASVELKKALRLHLHDQPDHEWDCSIPNVLFAIRRRRNAATGASPSKILYGQDLPYPGSWDAPATIAPLLDTWRSVDRSPL
ncbi:hypothetical protein MTP99_009402 [Tenebrio molitor]|nr:hypothetical protein MTP99_009402 [Tenebrio molitor]